MFNDYLIISFRNFFSREIIAGDPGKALERPFILALTESLSENLFCDTDPTGKSIKFAYGSLIESGHYLKVRINFN